jgi:amidophosphoribosyltransferase
MSDFIGHECGVAAVRLRKPYEYYVEKYGSPMYAVNKLYLMLEKQRNRGQDGVGVATVKLDVAPGDPYIARSRSAEKDPTEHVYAHMRSHFDRAREAHPEEYKDPSWVKKNVPFAGEVLLGHLRYGTHGQGGVSYCHPFLRQNNWMTRNLAVAGNFNLTNNNELFELLVELGQHPRNRADTVMVMEKIGHFLDEANDKLFRKFRKEGVPRAEISALISKDLDIPHILKASTREFDGGFVMCGIIGNGDMFVMRDPCGIRPAFYYADEEVVVVASERPAIQTAFGLTVNQVQEIKAGHALIVRKDGSYSEVQISETITPRPCSFERIYFSRGTDADIYKERKMLGEKLCKPILESINYDFENTVFSYIPNTAETAFLGLTDGMRASFCSFLKEKIVAYDGNVPPEKLDRWLTMRPRIDKIMTKDAKLRTFITSDEKRNDLVSLAYDTTYGVVNRGKDTLVVLDDSIVRGTTLRESILRIIDRLEPKKVIVVSSCPQIRYPDCYGIDMSQIHRFVAFTAAIELVKEMGRESLLQEIYELCKADEVTPRAEPVNHVKRLYDMVTADEVSAKISQMLKPDDMRAEFEVIYQTVEALHESCPNHKGDWYFTGNYPTPGGIRVVNRSFINYIEGSNERAY